MRRGILTLLMIALSMAAAAALAQPNQQTDGLSRLNFRGAEDQFGLGVDSVAGIEGVEFIGGYGEDTDNFRLAMQWPLFVRPIKSWTASFSLLANYSILDYEVESANREGKLRDAGLTPTVTFRSHKKCGFRPFVEMGVGFHYLSDKQVGPKDFSTRFQFGDHIGLGVEFGKRYSYKLAYQFQHLSNAGIAAPNPGINFHLLSMGFKLQK